MNNSHDSVENTYQSYTGLKGTWGRFSLKKKKNKFHNAEKVS
jgi:hypothetical protein